MRFFIAFLLSLYVAVASWAADASAAWDKGAFMLPAALAKQIGAPQDSISRIDRFAARLAAVQSRQPHPLAILLHGCFGLGGEQIEQARLLAAKGFAVFMPSHFGRPDSVPRCGGNAAGEPYFAHWDSAYLAQRLDELDLALQNARRLPFVDPNQTLVIGHSMGGGTVANMKRTDVTAVVITGWACPPGASSRAPAPLPQLSIRFRDDPWIAPGYDCGAGLFSGRKQHNTKSLVLEGQRSHEVMHDPRAREAIGAFVNEHFRPVDQK